MIYITNLTKEKTFLNYEDVTEKWLAESKPNSHRVKKLNKYVHNKRIYKVDNKNVVLEYSKKEKEVANWLKNTFGGEIYMCPRINILKNIQTPDYIWNNKKWDLKVITENAISKKRAVDNIIKMAKNQTENIILDVTNSKLSTENIIKQTSKIYQTSGREWIGMIIVKGEIR